ncbi:ATP-binding protein [Streptomyces sp. NPDC059896]|uniref:ATP-binding protein n=1 Tax=Streptomyces sp. NPDC059896 TaxID=3346993 RepID=UPI00366829BB
MKQSAIKTLGTVALGAAFAATAAGSAAAAPAAPQAGAALDLVTKTLPVGDLAGQLPAPLPDVLTATGLVLSTVQTTAPYAIDAVKTANPVQQLVGGLPVNGLGKGLPVNGIPLGG